MVDNFEKENYENLKAYNLSEEDKINKINKLLNNIKIKKNTIDSISTIDSINNTYSFSKILNDYRKFSLPENFEKYELNSKDKFETITNSNTIKKSIKSINNNIIILDWDDTLLCTSYLSPFGYFEENIKLNTKELELINKLQKKVISFLYKIIQFGDTFIVTNSELSWVDYSCQKFFPQLYKNKLLKKKIKIFSAREKYEILYPRSPNLWKIFMFNDIIQNYNKNILTNIICIGDSYNEIEAVKTLHSRFKECYIKCIKFKYHPNIQEINDQLNLVMNKMDFLFKIYKNLNITVEKKVSNNIKNI